jgi:pSer/pThr/pTyr-binding forkhead associated (FHA) protein
MILKLRVIQGKQSGKTLSFAAGDYILGRGSECHVRFDSDWVSRQHCQLRVGASGASVRDLGSRNGTLVNGLLCKGEQALGAGDHIQVGPVTFEVTLEDDSAPGPHTVDLGGSPPKDAGSTDYHPALPSQ